MKNNCINFIVSLLIVTLSGCSNSSNLYDSCPPGVLSVVVKKTKECIESYFDKKNKLDQNKIKELKFSHKANEEANNEAIEDLKNLDLTTEFMESSRCLDQMKTLYCLK